MANDWQGYRRLTVDECRFRWICSFDHPLEVHSGAYRERGASWPPDRLLIRPEDHPARLLTIIWPACRAPVVKPGQVRAWIDKALGQGWPNTITTLELAGADFAAPADPPPGPGGAVDSGGEAR